MRAWEEIQNLGDDDLDRLAEWVEEVRRERREDREEEVRQKADYVYEAVEALAEKLGYSIHAVVEEARLAERERVAELWKTTKDMEIPF